MKLLVCPHAIIVVSFKTGLLKTAWHKEVNRRTFGSSPTSVIPLYDYSKTLMRLY